MMNSESITRNTITGNTEPTSIGVCGLIFTRGGLQGRARPAAERLVDKG